MDSINKIVITALNNQNEIVLITELIRNNHSQNMVKKLNEALANGFLNHYKTVCKIKIEIFPKQDK